MADFRARQQRRELSLAQDGPAAEQASAAPRRASRTFTSLQRPRKVSEKRKRTAVENAIAVVPGASVGEGMPPALLAFHHRSAVALNYKLDSRTIEEKLSESKRSKTAGSHA